jgi:hypothetical protein
VRPNADTAQGRDSIRIELRIGKAVIPAFAGMTLQCFENPQHLIE